MGKNRSVDAERTKQVVRYLYSLAKRKGYLQDVMNAAGVTNVKSSLIVIPWVSNAPVSTLIFIIL